MAVQISREQMKDSAVNAVKMDLTDTFSFTSGVLRAATPSGDSDVATKQYVDSKIVGLSWKEAVRAATTTNITLSGTQTVDGVSLSVGDRVLVYFQTDKTENGVYVVASGSWSRSADMDQGSDFVGAAMFVLEGTTNDNLGFVCANDTAPTLGTDDIAFTQFNGAANITAGDGLDKTGNVLSVNVGSGLEISADAVQVAAAGITDAMLAGSISNAKLSNSTISGVSLGGNLSALSNGNGIATLSYNGSGSASVSLQLDGGTLSVSASGVKIATGGVDSLQLADGAVGEQKIANAAVTSTKIQDSAVTAAKIGTSAVTTAKINDGAVSSAKIATGAVLSDKIASGAVTRTALNSNVVNPSGALALDGTDNDLLVQTDKSTIDINVSNELYVLAGGITSTELASGAVTSAKIGDGEVGNSKIVDNAITAAKVQNGTLTAGKLNFYMSYETLSAGDGSTTTFEVGAAIDSTMLGGTIVFRNGLAMGLVASSPSGQDQYSLSATGGTGGVGQVIFGAAPNNGDQITVMYVALS